MNQLADPALSYFPLDRSKAVLELTTGDALRMAAQRHPSRTALVEVMPQNLASLTGAS